jgi:hypothetical protein
VEMAAHEYQALRLRYMNGAKTLASGEGEA